LDRDGVINVKRENDYVKTIEEFIFLEGAIESIEEFSQQFNRILIVTNQQGIGKGIMSHKDLELVHNHMESGFTEKVFDAIYYCPELASKNSTCRKPNIGMALQARQDFPDINFETSILVGDSISDIEMGKNAGMKTVFINNQLENPGDADLVVKSLFELNSLLKDD